MSRGHVHQVALAAIVVLAALLPSGCGLGTQPRCSGGLQPYQGKCLSNATIEYVGCTEGRGVNVTTETGGSVGGSFKAVADASLTIAHRKVQQENTPVALEIVKTCLELVRSSGQVSEAERVSVGEYQEQVDQSIEQWRQETEQQQVAETPVLSLSRSSGRAGDSVTVNGRHFIPGEPVEVSFNLSLLTQVTAGPDGSFTTTVTVPQVDVQPINYYILVQGRTSVRSARLPFQLTE